MEWPIAYALETSSGPLHDPEPLSEIAHSPCRAEVTFLQKPVAHLSLATRVAPTVQVGPGSISALLLSAPLSEATAASAPSSASEKMNVAKGALTSTNDIPMVCRRQILSQDACSCQWPAAI
jgi:hypothetical protein